jgi:hypothetical protein
MSTIWPYVDVIYSILTIAVSLAIFYERFGSGTPALRIMAAITSLVLWFKCLYFLRRVDQMNVTIEILLQMIQKTVPFMIIMLVVIFAFG